MKYVSERSSAAQTKVLNNLLKLNNTYYTVDQIFNILPQEIEYNGHKGYLRISPIDIIYSSVETEMQGTVVAIFQYLLHDQTIYDGFIEAIKWMKDHNIKTQID